MSIFCKYLTEFCIKPEEIIRQSSLKTAKISTYFDVHDETHHMVRIANEDKLWLAQTEFCA